MDDILNEKFRRNEYAWNKEKQIKWETHGRICHRLEDFCYKCPKCGKEFTMKGEKDRITCSNCGNGATMDDYYQFHPFEGAVIPESPFEWVEKERVTSLPIWEGDKIFLRLLDEEKRELKRLIEKKENEQSK